MKSIKLSNGVCMPFIGLGTGGKQSTPDELENAIRWAIDIGYRHIDTACMYENEQIIGHVLADIFKSGKLKREDIFITTKLPPTSNRPEFVEPTLRDELALLQTDYVDLYLVHSPMAIKPMKEGYKMYNGASQKKEHDTVDLAVTWKAMEKVYEAGLARAIGLSNFNVEQLQYVYQAATIKPHNLQIEAHLYFPQRELHTLCTALNISVTAYAPLGCPSKKGISGWPSQGDVDDPLVVQLATKYGRTPAQILLRYLLQRQIVSIPKSVNYNRLKENFNIFDFEISESDMATLNAVESRKRLYTWSGMGLESHPQFPFTDMFREVRRKSIIELLQ